MLFFAGKESDRQRRRERILWSEFASALCAWRCRQSKGTLSYINPFISRVYAQINAMYIIRGNLLDVPDLGILVREPVNDDIIQQP